MERRYLPNITASQKELIQKGEERGIFEIKNERIKYLDPEKEYDFSDPEEPVRAAAYAKLVFDWKYPPPRLDLEVYPPRREPKLPADIVVYNDDKKENIYIVVECKASANDKEKKEAKEEGLGNANLLLANWLFTACGREEDFYHVENCSEAKNLDDYRRPDLPILYDREPKYRFKKEEEEPEKVNLNVLHRRFSKCHDEIWEGGKRDPAEAFDEMSKLMFTKIYDERFTKVGEHYRFQIGSNENPYVIGERIRKIYREAQNKEPKVFEEDIEAPDEVIYQVADNLQDISLLETDLDAKGQAFEKFMGKLFRGELGQYFTPREVIDFMVRFINPDYNELVMDPACGSSGFLLYSIKRITEKAEKEYNNKSTEKLVWDFSHDNVFGIEINDRIARVAMMDMVIHDDGHTNIECNNALQDYDKFDPKKDIRPEKYDVLLTNPPFSGKETGEKILKNYDLGSKKKRRNSQEKKILFIERSLDLLKEGGRMGIVLPDGILTNSTLHYVRNWIKDKASLIGVISLPTQTFQPYDGADKTSILFLEKNGGETKNTPVFMGKANHVGYDTTGRPDENDFPFILEEYEKFKENPKNYEPEEIDGEKLTYSLDRGLLQNRLDYEYYHPRVLSKIEEIEGSDYEVVDLKEVIDDISTGKTFSRSDYSKSGEIFNIKVANLSNEGIKWDEISNYGSFTPKKMYKNHEKAQVKEGDILLTCSAHRPEYVGKDIDIVKDIPEKYKDGVICSGEVMKIRPNTSEVDPDYLLFYLRSEYGKVQIQRILTGQTAHLYPKDMKELFRVIRPPLDKQKNFASKLREKLKKSKELSRKASELKEEVDRARKNFSLNSF